MAHIIVAVHWIDLNVKKSPACGRGYSLYDGNYPTSYNIDRVNCRQCRLVYESRDKVPEEASKEDQPKVSRSDYSFY